MVRLLFLNSFEFPGFLNADSSYLLTRSIASELIRARGWKVDAILPDPRFGRTLKWEDPIPGLRWFPVEMRKSKSENEIIWSQGLLDLVNPFSGTRSCYDAVLCNNPVMAQRFLEIRGLRPDVSDLPVFVLDYSTRFYGDECELDVSNDAVMMTAYSGYAGADHVFFFTRYARKMALETARQLLAPNRLTKLASSEVLPIAFDADRVAANVLKAEKKPWPSAYFGGRLTMTKGGNLATEIFDGYFCTGRPLNVFFTTPSSGRSMDTLKGLGGRSVDYMTFLSDLTQDEAMQVMAGCHVSVFGQSVKMMPASCFERISAEVVTLVLKKGSEGILDGYPFLFSDVNEGIALLKKVLENYEQAKAQMRSWKERVDKEYSIQANVRRLAERIEMSVKANREKFKDFAPVYEVPVKVVETRGRVEWSKMLEILDRYPAFRRKTGGWLRARYTPSLWLVYATLAARFRVEEENGEPVFYSW